MFAKLICYFKGHRRGVFVHEDLKTLMRTFRCPRCGRRTSYPVRTLSLPAQPGSPAADTQEYLAKQREKLR